MASEKAKEAKETAAEKAKEAKETAAEKAKETKETAAEKAATTKEMGAGKGKEGYEATKSEVEKKAGQAEDVVKEKAPEINREEEL